MTTPVKRWWRSFSDPELQKPLFLIAYAIGVYTGAVTIISPPTSIQNELGPVLMLLTGVTWLAGGLICLVTIFTDWWWLERLGLILLWAGILAYFGTVLMVHLESIAGSRLTQLGVILLATIGFASRFLSIREWSYAPPKTIRR